MPNVSQFLRLISHMAENKTALEKYNVTIDDIQLFKKYLTENYANQSQSLDTEDSCQPCDWAIQDLAIAYSQYYHGYLAIVVCIFGLVANTLTVAVLTRKDMVCAPINRILTGIAMADMLLMMEYTSFAYYYYIELPEKLNFPYWGAAFILFHANFTQVLHAISVCLTLALAIWRYIAIGYPERNQAYCTERRCTMAITFSYILPVILCSPTYFILAIKSTVVVEDKEYTLYHTSLSDTAAANESYLYFNFWIYAVLIKLLPCLILTIITLWLIQTLFKAKKRKEVLRDYVRQIRDQDVKKKSKAERRAGRTTRMLVAVLCLFLVTEFPQGLFALLMGLKGKCVFLKCYQNYGEIMDILALLNGGINFILYCCMNRMFRITFEQLFKPKILNKLGTSSQSEIHTTPDVNTYNGSAVAEQETVLQFMPGISFSRSTV